MIDQVDIDFIDENQFEIIGKKPYTLVIRSRSTGHYWSLLEQVYNDHRTFQISHKHNAADSFHIQKSRPSVMACCEYIRSHDDYQIAKEREKEKRRMRRQAEKKRKPSKDDFKEGVVRPI